MGRNRYRKKKSPEKVEAQRVQREQYRRDIKRMCSRGVNGRARRDAQDILHAAFRTEAIFMEQGRGYAEIDNDELRRIIGKKNRQRELYRNGHAYHLYFAVEQDGHQGDKAGRPEYLTFYKYYTEVFRSMVQAAVFATGYAKDFSTSQLKMFTDLLDAYINETVPPAKSRIFSVSALTKGMEKNPRYQEYKVLYATRDVLREIPEDITELFPLARSIKRHFILHVGDTNSGKTYQAIEDMKQAEAGVYLAPLRLLALEIQERLLGAGVKCSLLTGEEEDLITDATHMSSTVEMLDLTHKYDVCVIDEAQMIDEEQRGWAWTKAILGAYADRIHVCMSENALSIVKRLINTCGDSFEVVEHRRNTPLVYEQHRFNFPEDIQPHDALIVFSRKKVLWVAAELDRKGIKASVIYGSLPYSVRKNEIAKFVSGRTDVVISTDAIGMGMNLPVRRIVFLESVKFDGKGSRMLRGPEVKQIAGRAGRQGMYDTGYVNALYDSEYLEDLLYEPYDSIGKARLQMPERLLDLDMTLSEIIYSWNNISNDALYRKADVSVILKKCEYMEELEGLSKAEMWRFALIPFDERNKVLWQLWKDLIFGYYDMQPLTIEQANDSLSLEPGLSALETNYKILDLYYSFSRAINFNENDFRHGIALMKEIVSDRIITELRNLSSERKTCKICGRPMLWNSEHDVCGACYRKIRVRRTSDER